MTVSKLPLLRVKSDKASRASLGFSNKVTGVTLTIPMEWWGRKPACRG